MTAIYVAAKMGKPTPVLFLNLPLQSGCHMYIYDKFGNEAKNKAVRPAKEMKNSSESLKLENQHLMSMQPAFWKDRWENGQDHCLWERRMEKNEPELILNQIPIRLCPMASAEHSLPCRAARGAEDRTSQAICGPPRDCGSPGMLTDPTK